MTWLAAAAWLLAFARVAYILDRRRHRESMERMRHYANARLTANAEMREGRNTYEVRRWL